MNFRRFRTGLGLVAFILVATAGAGVAQLGPNPNAPNTAPLPNINRNATSQSTSGPVTPPPPTLGPDALASAVAPQGLFPAAAAATTAVPAPTATPSGGPKRGKKPAPSSSAAPEDKDTPEPPQFTTLDGIWEIELQPPNRKFAVYEHFSIEQKGSVISGYWEHEPHKTRTPISGTFDGRVIRIQAALPDSTVTFAGYVESFGDMVGMQHLTDKDPGTAFTAQHRKKQSG